MTSRDSRKQRFNVYITQYNVIQGQTVKTIYGDTKNQVNKHLIGKEEN